MSDYKPAGFHDITPFLTLKDAQGFLEFVREAFGAETIMNHVEDGRVVHAEMRVYGCVLELSEARDEWPATRSAFHVYVPDTDKVYNHLIGLGLESLHPVTDMPYGERSGGVKDRWDNHWYIATVTDHEVRTTPPK